MSGDPAAAEAILNSEQVKMIQKLTATLHEIDSQALNPQNAYMFYPSIQKATTPDFVQHERPNITVHYDKMFEFNGDFNNSEQLLNQMQKVAKGTTTKILDEINRDFKYRR